MPTYECEITDGRTTARITVDQTDDDIPYTCLALEPNEGDLRQSVISLDRSRLVALMDMAARALAALDRQAVALDEREAA